VCIESRGSLYWSGQGDHFSATVREWALDINAAQMFVPHMDGDEIICAKCGSFITPESGIECLQAMVRLIVFGCKFCEGEDEPFPDDGEMLDPHYELTCGDGPRGELGRALGISRCRVEASV
jgi:hypothetical protein